MQSITPIPVRVLPCPSVFVRVSALLVSIFFATLPPLRAEQADAIIARVNGEAVLLSQLKQAALDQSVPPRAMLGDPLHNEAYKRAITQLVDETLLVQRAGLEEIKPNETEVAREVENMLTDLKNQFKTPAELNDFLVRQKLSLDSLKEILTQRERRRALAARVVLKRVQVDPASVDAFIKDRQLHNKPTEELNLSQIILSSTGNLKESRAELQKRAMKITREAGADPSRFGALAREFSTDPSARDHGGYLGWVDPSSMLPPLRGQLTGMKPGDISPPIETPQGLHILMLHARHDPRDLLFSQTYAQQRARLAQQLRKEANIKLYDLRGNPLQITPSALDSNSTSTLSTK